MPMKGIFYLSHAMFFHEYVRNPLLLVLFTVAKLKCITRYFLLKRSLAQPFINSQVSLYINNSSNLSFV